MVTVVGIDKKRRSGRTTRMLQAAIEKARGGQYVMVYAGNLDTARALQEQAAVMTGTKPYATKIAVGSGEITFESTQDPQWDWEGWRARGAYPTIPIFVDHAAIEFRYLRALYEWTRWDE